MSLHELDLNLYKFQRELPFEISRKVAVQTHF